MKPPVFVLGSPRSGTTLLYHMLLSAGGFAVYRAETHVFNLVAPKYGDLSLASNKQRLLQKWLTSKFFKVSGLDATEIQRRIMADCRGRGDFLRIVMEEVAHKQGVERWAECTPEHLLYLREIKRELPQALVIHIIRDGRDVAVSLARQKWIQPMLWDKGKDVLVAGLYWRWIVQKGREAGRQIAPDYMEVHFENLVNQPAETLSRIGEFIHHDLDYQRIQQVAVGSVHDPNTSFENKRSDFNPVGRFKEELVARELARLEALIGDSLEELGYAFETPEAERQKNNFEARRLRVTYGMFFDAKQWLKSNTPLGRFANAELLEQDS